jgi:4-aminobutyrate aminotransferase-like enzyme
MVGRTGPVFGDNGNTIKLKPAVNATKDELMEMLERFEAALAEVEVES